MSKIGYANKQQAVDPQNPAVNEQFSPGDANEIKTSVNALYDTVDGKQNSLGFTAENAANKAIDLTSNDDTHYPTVKAVKTVTDAHTVAINGKQANLGFTPENAANKAIDLTSNDDTHYPTVKAVKTVTDAHTAAINSKQANLGFAPENAANKAIDLTSNDDTHYPTVKAVKTELNAKANLADVLAVTADQSAGLTAGQTYFLSLIKSAIDGKISLDTTVRSVNIFAPPTVNPLLMVAAWGNVVGESIEYTLITGNNLTGGLGRGGQLAVIGGAIYVCLNHSDGTTSANGTAKWARNKSINFLDDVADAALIAELRSNDGWNSDQFKGTTHPAVPGTPFAKADGYFYICISQFEWRRQGIGSVPSKPMQITADTHPTLTGHLNAHDFVTNGNYTQVTGDELTHMTQEYRPANKNYFFTNGSPAQGWAIVQTNTINPS